MNLQSYVPQDRLRAIERFGKLPDRTRGAVLFADISGFTPLTESLTQQLGARRGIEELTLQINRVYDELIAEIERHCGGVISFAGDAITCWFDDADGGGAAPLRATACAFALQAAMLKFPQLGLKTAVATGAARRFLVGDPNIHYIDTLAGDTVARTAAGEHLAGRGDVMVDEATAEALGPVLEIGEWRTDEGSGQKYGVASRLSAEMKPCESPSPPEVSASTLRPYIHPAVYEREASGLGSFLTELRPCVALFLRFTGIDFDTDDAQGKLDGFIRRVQEIVTRHDGAVMQLIIGDKGSYLYINFGVLSTHEDDARRAIRSALEMHGICDLCLQIGITEGMMRVGTYGAATRCTYSALGDDVNLSARLMMNAQPGEILVSSAVQKSAGPWFTFEPREPLPMKGKAEPLPVFAVSGERQQRAMRLQEPAYTLPMVGRASELKTIEEKLDLAAAGGAQVIGIAAEAGMGKSRLVAEAIRSARKKGFTGYGGACQADGIHTPYLAWKAVWSAYFDVDPYTPAHKMTRLLEMEIEERAPKRLNALPLLGPLLGLAIPDNEFTAMLEPKIRQSALHALLEDCLKSAAAEGPLLIVIEDFHWIDPLSHDLLEELARELARLRVCFILAYRPLGLASQIAPRLRSLPQFTKLELHELDNAEAAQAVRAKLAQLYPARSGEAVAPALVEKLMARSQGNPFFLEELLNYLRDRGLDPHDPADLGKIELPQNLHTLILSRLDQLIERQKTILRLASIVGRVFPVSWLTGYYPEIGGLSQVLPDLDELRALEITSLDTTEPETAYLFKHIVLHEVTYESLPFDIRAKLHERLAHYLEEQYSGALPLETLAYHYGRSNNTEKQREYLLKAGKAAQHQFANEAALVNYTQLLPLIEAPAGKIGVHTQRGTVLEMLGRWDEAEEDYRAAATLAQQADDPAAAANAHLALGKLNRLRCTYDAALEWLEKARAGSAELDDKAGLGRALAEAGLVWWRKGDYPKARETINAALELVREGEDRQALAQTITALGTVVLHSGDTATARTYYEESLAIQREIGDKAALGTSYNNLGIVTIWQGDAAAAKGFFEQGLELRRETGERGAIAISLGNVADSAFALGDYATARRMQLESLAIKRGLGDKYGLAVSLTNLGNIALVEGNAAEARAYQQECLEVTTESGDKPIMAYALQGLGMAILAGAKGAPEAIAEARKPIMGSLRLRQEIGEQTLVTSSLIVMASSLLVGGDAHGAAKMLGAVDTALKTMGAFIDTDIAYYYKKLLADIQEKLGGGFQGAWDEGAAMTLEEAIMMADGAA
jgi:adenylate cyclase